MIPFEPLKEKMAKFMRWKEAATTVTAIAATTNPSCSYVQSPADLFRDEEGRESTRINIVWS